MPLRHAVKIGPEGASSPAFNLRQSAPTGRLDSVAQRHTALPHSGTSAGKVDARREKRRATR